MTKPVKTKSVKTKPAMTGPKNKSKTARIEVCVALSLAWRAHFSEMQKHLPGVLAGNDDSEDLHQLRIALRQTRALLKIARHVIPDIDKFATEFKWLAAVTGAARDSDIQLQYVRDRQTEKSAGVEQILAYLETKRARQQLQLIKNFSGVRCQNLLAAWQQFISTLLLFDAKKYTRTDLPLTAHTPVSIWAMVTIIKQCRQLLQHGLSIDAEAPATALHELRIRCKRLRYVLESLSPFLKKRHLDVLLEKLVALQKILGAHQDAIIAAAQWRKLIVRFSAHDQTTSAASVALLLNWLGDAERLQRELRAQFPDAFLAFAKVCEF